MDEQYEVCFNIKNLGMYGIIPNIEEAMKSELVRVYNKYAEKTNSGIIEELNREFVKLHPNYFDEDDERDLMEYNQFMSDGFQRLIVDEFNRTNISPILGFYIEPTECVFTGYLKRCPEVTIDFYLKKI